MQWDDFIRQLQHDIDWTSPTIEQLGSVEDLLQKVGRNVDSIAKRFLQVTESDELFSAYSAHHEYPRPNMDKFVIYMDDLDRFRIRIHKFQRRTDNLMVMPSIHDHRWCFSSLILTGSYRECRYDIHNFDPTSKTAFLSLAQDHVLSAGDVNSILPGVPHSATNESDVEDSYTLFVRGRTIVRDSRVFDLNANSFYWAFGFRDALANQARLFAEATQGIGG